MISVVPVEIADGRNDRNYVPVNLEGQPPKTGAKESETAETGASNTGDRCDRIFT